MEGYREVFSTNNPIEFDQLFHLLEQSGVPAQAKGREALNIGNVELTGVAGASILVPEEKMQDAKKTLQSAGYDTHEQEDKKSLMPIYFALGILLLTILIFMIKSALTD